MKRWKRLLRGAVKVIATIAMAVFIVANPLTNNLRNVIAFFISIPVLLLCFFLWLLLNKDKEQGYWPEKPHNS